VIILSCKYSLTCVIVFLGVSSIIPNTALSLLGLSTSISSDSIAFSFPLFLLIEESSQKSFFGVSSISASCFSPVTAALKPLNFADKASAKLPETGVLFKFTPSLIF